MLIDAQLNDYEDFSNIPPASYEFIIKEPVESNPLPEPTDIGGKAFQFIIRPEVVGGEQAGKKLRKTATNKSKASRYFLRSFLEKIGVNIQEGGGFTTEDLLGRRFRGTVGERLGKVGTESEGKKYADLDTESIVAL